MKFNSKFFFRLMIFAALAFIITYTMSQNLAFSSFYSDDEKSSVTTEPEPEVSVPAYDSIFSPELEVLQDKIQKKANQLNINGSVLVAYKDQVVYQEDFGFKNPITKEKMASDLSFQLASVSKQFTAAAVLKLQEMQLLDIDEPVAKYLPGFKFEEVSVRDLLKHRSGLWNYMSLTEKYWENDVAPNNLDVVELINKHARKLNFPSGEHFSYSNTGYVVLGAIVEQLSQKPLGKFIKDEFLTPLSLENTFVQKKPSNKARILDGYQAFGNSYIKLPAGFHNGALGDKGIYASANDLFVWFKNLKNGEFLSENSLTLMFGANNENQRYGMGFRLKNENDESIIYHNGLWDGFRNGLVYFPEEDLVFIVLTHTQNKRKKHFQNHLIETTHDLIQTAEHRLKRQKANSKLVL